MESPLKMQRAGDSPVIRALLALQGERCQCGKTKKVGHAFCLDCYAVLPVAMQKDLWKRVGEGFEAAHETAAKWLIHD